MKKTILAAALGLGLASGVAFADIASDLQAGLPLAQVVANAQAQNKSLSEIVAEVIKQNPDLAGSVIQAALAIDSSEGSQSAIKSAALDAGASPTIVNDAVSTFNAGTGNTGNTGNTNGNDGTQQGGDNTSSLGLTGSTNQGNATSGGTSGGGGGGGVSTNPSPN